MNTENIKIGNIYIEKNTKYNYKVKLKIQTNDIWNSLYIKNWIQKQRKNDYGTVDGQI